MDKVPLIVEQLINAPAARIWQALTDIEQIRQWYFDLKDFKAEVGYTFEFSGGDETKTYLHRCVVTEVVPGKKLAYTWTYPDDNDGASVVSWQLIDQGEQTLVRITHTGLETFPKTPSFKRENFNGGWTYILGTGLKKFIEK